jgi:predicted TIM-barrel fold metal-dependent hydrolase
MSHAQREAAFRGELGYSQMVPGAYEPRPRLAAMDVVRMKPSDYFKRQGWISFDTDEHALQFSANDPLVGAERIIWASDFPHPDAKYPGTVKELIENTGQLSEAQKQRVYGENARELYGLPKLARRSGAGR